MPLAQGKRIEIITRKEFEVEMCLEGWCKPEDVPDLKARGK